MNRSYCLINEALFLVLGENIFMDTVLIRSMEHIDDVKYDEMGYFSFDQTIMIYPCGLHRNYSILNHHCEMRQ